MNSKIAMSALSIMASLAIMGGATFALFTDTATSQNNTFSTGNASLLIAPAGASPGTYGESIPAPAINELNIVPGFSKDYKFWLKNDSSSAISLNLTATFDDVVTTVNPDIANQMTVQFTCRSDTDNNISLDTVIATSGTFSVNTWDAGSDSLGTLGLNDGDSDGTGPDEAECTMHVALPSGLDNTYANSSVMFDGVFDATQVVGP